MTIKYIHRKNLVTEQGVPLSNLTLAFRTFGHLNNDRSNAILVCPALNAGCNLVTTNNDAQEGWWDVMVGPGRPIDTDTFFVICPSNLGTPFGSSPFRSPQSPSGEGFPQLTVLDWVHSQEWLLEHLELPFFFAVIGGSLGGMQALTWGAAYPERIKHCVAIATAPYLDSINLAYNHVARTAISVDGIDTACSPANLPSDQGLRIARMLAHITYSSMLPGGWERKIAGLTEGSSVPKAISIGRYLDNQAERFVRHFDQTSYLAITYLMDAFNLETYFQRGAQTRKSFAEPPQYLVVAFSDDRRFPPARSIEIIDILADQGARAVYHEIKGNRGHDGFLCTNEAYMRVINDYLGAAWTKQNLMFAWSEEGHHAARRSKLFPVARETA